MEAFEDPEEGSIELKVKFEAFSCVIDGADSETKEFPGKGATGEIDGTGGATEGHVASFKELIS
jgi:hypothetical protein